MKLALVVIFLFATSISSAQNPRYSLLQLLRRVTTEYPSIKGKQANINAANYYVAAARKDMLPDVIVADQYHYSTNNGLEGSYYSNEGTSISTSGGIREHN